MMDQCLLCCSEVTEVVENCSPQKSPLDQLNDLLQVFRISLSSFEQIQGNGTPPQNLFCDKCGERVREALYTLSRIESLQNDLKIISEFLKESLFRNQIVMKKGNGTTWVHTVRKTLTQCFSTSKVDMSKSKDHRRPSDEHNSEDPCSELMSDESGVKVEVEMNYEENDCENSVRIMSPGTVLEDFSGRNDILPECDVSWKESSDPQGLTVDSDEEGSLSLEDNIFPSWSEGEIEMDRNYLESGLEVMPGSYDPLEVNPLSTSHRMDRPGPGYSSVNRWIHNECETIVAFQCGNCNTLISREDYKNNCGKFDFKCLLESCGKVSNRFRSLCTHHRSHCLGRSLTDPSRQPSQNEAIRSVPGGESKPGRIYDGANRLTSLECQNCDTTLALSDFWDTTTNKFVFNCTPSCCSNVFPSFLNLVSHHELKCKPIAAPMRTYRPAGAGALHSQTITNQQPSSLPPPPPLRLPEFPRSFKCKHCLKEYKKEECEQMDSSGATFRCSIPNCGRAFISFALLRNHHESTCPSKTLLPTNQVPKTWVCSICGLSFKNRTANCRHRRKVHNIGKVFNCESCGYRCYRSDLLARHKRTAH